MRIPSPPRNTADPGTRDNRKKEAQQGRQALLVLVQSCCGSCVVKGTRFSATNLCYFIYKTGMLTGYFLNSKDCNPFEAPGPGVCNGSGYCDVHCIGRNTKMVSVAGDS